MAFKALFKFSLFGLFCFLSFQSVGAIMVKDTTVVYPYYTVSNYRPVKGETISIKWVLGMHHDACVPKFNTKVTKTIKNGVISYFLEYKKILIDYDSIACAQVFTEYGPQFEVGPLESGYSYKIYVDTFLIREFTLEERKYPYAIINPEFPQQGDTVVVQWVLGEDSVNCVQQFTDSIVSRSILKSNPPINMINVDFKQKSVQYVTCVPRPTIYGPSFNIGAVGIGDYVIYYDTTLVAKFSVQEKVDPWPVMVMKQSPEQPTEGDSLVLHLITEYGSSSCAPRFFTSYELLSGENGVHIYKLNYETQKNTDTICTMDIAAIGPKWIIPHIQAGSFIFKYSEDRYYKVYVSKKRQQPDFPYVTVKGSVYDMRKAVDTLGSNYRDALVPQCTVMVVFQSLPYTNKPVIDFDTLKSPEQSQEYHPYQFTTVTNESGEYSIIIPSHALLNMSYTIATKDGMVGYGTIPEVLTEVITSDIILFKLEAFVDSMRTILNGTEDVVALLKNLGIDQAASIETIKSVRTQKASIIPVSGGFQLVNPSKQQISLSAFTMDGKRIWNHKSAKLSDGRHFFTIPRVTSGVFLIRVQGENFVQSKVITISR